jgi:hypothetical protein
VLARARRILDLGWFQEVDANKMPIEPLADEENFEPETLEAMRTAYRMARQPPQLEHAADAWRTLSPRILLNSPKRERPVRGYSAITRYAA